MELKIVTNLIWVMFSVVLNGNPIIIFLEIASNIFQQMLLICLYSQNPRLSMLEENI